MKRVRPAIATLGGLAIATTLGVPALTASATPAAHVVAAVPNTIGDNSDGGYILYSDGVLAAYGGAPFYGDARAKGLNDFTAVGQATANSGYWLVTATGKVYTYGNICQGDTIQEPKVAGPIVGTMFLTGAQQNNNNIDTGFLMVNSAGTVYLYACIQTF